MFFLRSDMNEPAVHGIANGEACVLSRPAPESGRDNQDGVVLIPAGPYAVLAVADGCGGLPGGDEASSLALKMLAESVTGAEATDPSGLRSAILDGFERANQAVLELGTGAATTLAVAALFEDSVRTFHAGDSVVLLTGQRGKIKLHTVAHSPTGYAVEAGVLDEEAAATHDERNLVLNIVGSKEMSIDIGPEFEFSSRDTLLLASDGLSDNLFVDEIVDLVRKGPLEQAMGAVIDAATSRMEDAEDGAPSHPDDLTVVLYRKAG